MAKLTAPLLSFDARGGLGKTLVFMGWKGIKTVRQFVVPANPKSVLQVLQRSFMTFAVACWKITTTNDKLGWNNYAAVLATPLSGFNAFTREAIGSLRALNPTAAPQGFQYALTPQSVSADVSIAIKALQTLADIDASTDFSVNSGTDIRDMSTQTVLVQASPGDPYLITVTSLLADVPVFMQVVDTVNGTKMSGIITVVPTA